MEEKLDSLVIVDALYVYQVFQSHKKGRPDFVKMHQWVKTNLAKKGEEDLKPKYYYITSGLSDKTPVMKKLKKYYIVPELNTKSERSKCPKCSHKLDWGRQSDVDTEIALCLLEQGLLNPNIKTIVLFAGDGDFYRLLTRIVADSSKTMIVVGDKSSASSKLQSLIGKNYVQIPYEELVFSKAAAVPAGSASAAGGKGKYKVKGAASKSAVVSGDLDDEESKMEDEEYLESLDDSLESGEDFKDEESASGKTSRAASVGSKEDDIPKYLKNSIMKVEAVVAKPKKPAASAAGETRVSRATSVPMPGKSGKRLGGAALVQSMSVEEDVSLSRALEEEDSMESVAHIAHGVLKMLDFEQFSVSASSSFERKEGAEELLRFSRTEFSRDVSLASWSTTTTAPAAAAAGWPAEDSSIKSKLAHPRVF